MSYKDLSQDELAEMSDSEIETLIRRELMEQGIKEFEDPGEFDLPKPHIKVHKLYEVEGIKFATSALAEKFLALNPFTSDYHWKVGNDFRFAKQVDREIKIVELYDKEDVEEHGNLLVAWNSQYRRWEERKRYYEAYMSRRNGIYSEVWAAVTKSREAAQEAADILKSWHEYITLANGDREVAAKFLIKTYGEEKVRAVVTDLSKTSCSSEEEEVTA